jgi:hypothetical protein
VVSREGLCRINAAIFSEAPCALRMFPRQREVADHKAQPPEALAVLIGLLTIATLGLAPDQSQTILGVEFLAVGIMLWVFTVILHVRQLRRAKQPWWWLGSRGALCEVTTLSF